MLVKLIQLLVNKLIINVIGDQINPGLLPLTLNYIIKKNGLLLEQKYEIMCNFFEIYNEDIYDLLNSETPLNKTKRKLYIKEKDKKFYVHHLTDKKISTIENFNEALNEGTSKKAHAATNLNQYSSRSHTIFKIILRNVSQDHEDLTLSIVDLAGSERAYRSETSGKELQEACKINQSLSVLGKCMDAMKHNSIYNNKKIVPFRESKLTMLFHEYFQGDQNIVMLTNISPAKEDIEETLRVLSYSCIAKEIKPSKSKIISNSLIHVKQKQKLNRGNISDSAKKSSKYKCNISDSEHSSDEGVIVSNNIFNYNLQSEIENLKLNVKSMYEKYEDQEYRCEQLENKNNYLMKLYSDVLKKSESQGFNEVIHALENFSENIISIGNSSIINTSSEGIKSEEKIKYVIFNSYDITNEEVFIGNNFKSVDKLSNIGLLSDDNSTVNASELIGISESSISNETKSKPKKGKKNNTKNKKNIKLDVEVQIKEEIEEEFKNDNEEYKADDCENESEESKNIKSKKNKIKKKKTKKK